MDGHCFVSALFYALIGLDAFMSKPMLMYALSLSSSTTSLTSSLLDPLSPVTSILDEQQQQHTEKSTNNGNKNKSNNNIIGRNANSNSIPTSKPKSMCKLSEWKCSNGSCIPLSKFCNGIADCNDKSDEPNECSGKLEKIHPSIPPSRPFTFTPLIRIIQLKKNHTRMLCHSQCMDYFYVLKAFILSTNLLSIKMKWYWLWVKF